MLIKNINVQDGLVNGVQGIVTNFLQTSNENRPFAVVVKFDNPETGKLQRQQFSNSDIPNGSTPIFQDDAKFQVGKYKTITVTRKQYHSLVRFTRCKDCPWTKLSFPFNVDFNQDRLIMPNGAITLGRTSFRLFSVYESGVIF